MGSRVKLPKQNKTQNKKDLFKTPKGKGIAAGLILVVIIMLVMLVTTFALPQLGNQSADVTNTVPQNSVQPTTRQAQSTETVSSTDTTSDTGLDTSTVASTDTASPNLSGYKDPFQPLAMIASPAGSTTSTPSSSSTPSTDPTYAASSLTLKSITTQDGIKYATVAYQGQEYVVKEGDKVGDSQYTMADIGDGSATLLYGDSFLTLQVGDLIIK